MPISRISAPDTVLRAAVSGSSAARQPRKMKNSAISRTGSAIASPRSRSLYEATIPSWFTPRSPPTCTVAPGTVPRAAERSAVTTPICDLLEEFLLTSTTITLACPPGEASARSAGLV